MPSADAPAATNCRRLRYPENQIESETPRRTAGKFPSPTILLDVDGQASAPAIPLPANQIQAAGCFPPVRSQSTTQNSADPSADRNAAASTRRPTVRDQK